ncbi:MAG TPA: SigE family RNA polymerase sigma factor [Acidimicrobiales bacterium]|nr:SigE family RNA polymerase sigma factor [Acidimicrobiales bacterium]
MTVRAAGPGGGGGAAAARAAICGDTQAFEQMAALARPQLVRVAHSVTHRHEDAEDAVQSSLLKAMGAWSRVESQENWRQQAYVRQIVVNTCRSGWRKWGARVSVGEMPELSQSARTDAVDDRDLVRQALMRLPTRQREILVLRYFEDLSEAEIAARVGCAPGTVKSSAARALKSLRDILAEQGETGACTGRGVTPVPIDLRKQEAALPA